MKALQILSLSVFMLSFGCRPEIVDPPIDPEPPIVDANPVDFENPVDGQETRFLRYTTTCDALDDNFVFTQDTLVLSVKEENGSLYFIEDLTPNSPLYPIDINWEPIKHKIVDQEGRILLPERWGSFLFGFYGNDTLHLNPEKVMPLNQEGCRLILSTEPFIGNEIGKISSFEFGEIKQEDRTAVSCVPIFFEVEAYLFYSENSLHMSHQVRGDSTVEGWTRID